MARVLTSVGYCLLFIRVLSQSFRSPTIPGRFTIIWIKQLLNIKNQLGFYFTENYQGLLFRLLKDTYQKNNFGLENTAEEDINFSIPESSERFLILYGAKNPILTIKE